MSKFDTKYFENIRERLAQAKKERQEKAKAIFMKHGFYERHLAFIERLKEKSLINKETKTLKFKGQTFDVPQGKSMYDVVVENGYKGTRQEFIKELFNVEKFKERIETLRNKKQ